MNPNGRLLYLGPSMLDGAPIVAIATGFAAGSGNSKTGHMVQTWILRQDTPPHLAYKGPEGASVCGNCPHRINQTCYVSWWQGPRSVWECWRHGAGYPPATPADFDNVDLRIGSAGDPAAVPVDVWLQLLPRVRSHTGYTHQWRSPRFASFMTFLQASCDKPEDHAAAKAAGWRTFTVLPVGAPDLPGTVHCAASAERGNKTTCQKCGLCNGRSADVVITAHGSRKGAVPTW
jgi:hypothetical protein